MKKKEEIKDKKALIETYRYFENRLEGIKKELDIVLNHIHYSLNEFEKEG